MDPRRDSVVFVWPLHLLGALYADLASGQQNHPGFTIKHTAQGEAGERGDKLTIKFNCKSPLLNGCRVRLEVSGERAVGNFDAERSVAVAMFEALRWKYKIFSSDYSYGVIAEKRPLFNLMSQSLKACIGTYQQLDAAIDGMHDSVVNLSADVCTWLTSNNQTTTPASIEAIGSLNQWLTTCTSALDRDRKRTLALVSGLAAKERYPESLVQLNRTAPMPMQFDWEASYSVLRTEFDKAMSKLQATVTPIEVSHLSDGTHTATIKLSVEPYQFTNEPAHSTLAAKAKLMFAALKHVDTVLGYKIIDFHHALKDHIESHINEFDHKVRLVCSCAERMYGIGLELHQQLIRMKTEVAPLSSPTPKEDLVNISINQCADLVAEFAVKLEAAMSKLHHQKVTREALESLIGPA